MPRVVTEGERAVGLTPWRARGLLGGWFVFHGASSAAFWFSIPALLTQPEGSTGTDHGFAPLLLAAMAGMGLMLLCGARTFMPTWPRDIAAAARAASWPASVAVTLYVLVLVSLISGTIHFGLIGLRS